MELTPFEAYEKMIIRAVLMDDTDLWAEANTHACAHSFNAIEIERCHTNVEKWLRLHGVTKLKEREKAAIILIQSSLRRYLVLKKLNQQFDMYSRLARLDNYEHSKRALTLMRILTCAWQQVHRRKNVV